MNVKLILCVLAVAATVAQASAQRKILGRILDSETQKPVKEANIELEGTSTSTVTNYLGFFELSVDSTNHVLMITHAEFKPLRMVIPVEDKFKISLDRKSSIENVQSLNASAFYGHLRTNLRYPETARRMQVEGEVLAEFAVDATGATSNILVRKGIGLGCDEEVVRVVKSLPVSFGQMLTRETSFRKFLLPVRFGLGQPYTEGHDSISAEADAFILKVVDLVAVGIERPHSGSEKTTQTMTIRHVELHSYTSLSTALQHAKTAKTLSLVDHGMILFPPEIFNLPNLESLDLDLNKLTAVPNDISKLSKLEGLFLFSNELHTLPASIGNLKNLTTLGLASNHFTMIPSAIFALEKLEALDLSGNQLHELPPMIASLKNLRTLALNANAIHTIPPEVFELKKLEKLFIQGNPISADEVARLKAILKKVEVIF